MAEIKHNFKFKFLNVLNEENAIFFFWGFIPKEEIEKFPSDRISEMMDSIDRIATRFCYEPDFNDMGIARQYFCGAVLSQEHPFYPLSDDDSRVKFLKEMCKVVISDLIEHYPPENFQFLKDAIHREYEYYEQHKEEWHKFAVKYSKDSPKPTHSTEVEK